MSEVATPSVPVTAPAWTPIAILAAIGVVLVLVNRAKSGRMAGEVERQTKAGEWLRRRDEMEKEGRDSYDKYWADRRAKGLNPRRRRRRSSKNPHVPFDVYLKRKLIDTVFYSDPRTTSEEVKRGLINHDGYDPGIRVVKCRRKRGK